METPYRAVSFNTNDILTRAKLDQLATNYQWIKDNTPRSQVFVPDRPPKTVLNVIVGGRVRIKKSKKKDTERASVSFPAKTFAANCKPNVTTGVVADFQRQIFCVTHGPKKLNLPNSTGFGITVNVAADKRKQDVIKKDFWIHWHAFGYRTEDMVYG